jgi:predicted PurR-regulated permease PerM
VALIGYFAFQSLNFIFIILTAFVISMAIENLISFFQRWMSRGFSIGLSYFFLIIFVLSGIVIVVPFVGQQIAEIISQLVNKIYEFQQSLQTQ